MCSELTYDVTTAGSPWPHRFDQLAFYDKYIAPRPKIYGNKFDVYAKIQADVGDVGKAKIAKRLDETTLIRKNFVGISVLFESYSNIEIEESPTVTVDLLTSLFVGALCLWMGITTTFLIEVVELVYNIFAHTSR